MVYEHRLYLPVIGPIVLFVAAVVKGWEKIASRLRLRKEQIRTRTTDTPAYRSAALRRAGTDALLPIWAFFLVLTGLLCLGSYDRNKTWLDPVTLWEDCVLKNHRTRNGRTTTLDWLTTSGVATKRPFRSFRKAILLNPAIRESCSNLGIEPPAWPLRSSGQEKAGSAQPDRR